MAGWEAVPAGAAQRKPRARAAPGSSGGHYDPSGRYLASVTGQSLIGMACPGTRGPDAGERLARGASKAAMERRVASVSKETPTPQPRRPRKADAEGVCTRCATRRSIPRLCGGGQRTTGAPAPAKQQGRINAPARVFSNISAPARVFSQHAHACRELMPQQLDTVPPGG
jgi:hypothetical protein